MAPQQEEFNGPEVSLGGHVNEAYESAAAEIGGNLEEEEATIEFSSASTSLNEDTNSNDEDGDEDGDQTTISIRNATPDIEYDKTLSQMEQNLARVASNQVHRLDPSRREKQAASESGGGQANGKRSGAEFVISWTNLDYVVESQWYKLVSQRKPILNKLSGSFRSGQLSAVLGPSGAGKSTLINCLLGKRERGTSGQTRVSFADPDYETMRRQKRPLKIVTIPQEDHLLETLTVTETFMFASKIKNAQNYSCPDDDDATKTNGKRARTPLDHFANVQRVIQQLNLTSCASQRCGKLSGGQYKRVSIGQELLSRPDLMILDEPTSGLDSVTCYQTISALRELVDTSPYPMAIVCTIHQPDSEVFSLFHKAYVLAAGGRAIYEGPTERIFATVQAGADLVEGRRAKLEHQSGSLTPLQQRQQMASLREQLDRADRDRSLNPARLIVQVAANEYGFELTGAMNDLQRRQSSANSWSQANIEDTDDEHSTRIYITHQPETPSSSSSMSRSRIFNTGDNYPVTSQRVNIGADEPSVPRAPPFDYLANDPRAARRAELDELLNLEAANMNQRRSCAAYLRHLGLHCHRSWVTIVRDPMLCALQLVLHIFVPLMISYAFSEAGKLGDACPRVGPLDVVDEAYTSANMLDELNRELRFVFENLGYMFFQIYVIIFAAVCVTSLTYPLVMHVLLKEYRNGWYSMSSYFLGRTLADLPVPTVNVALAMAISYHLTGQPVAPYHWRFATVAALTVLATLVAQTQGLMFGALLMNLPQSAVFVAPASTAPLVVVSGFLIRISSLPVPLQLLSKLSYFTHLLNGFVVARYGFNRCPCEPSMFELEPERQVPLQARTVINLWVDTFAPEYGNATAGTDIVAKLVDTVTRAKTFNFKIDTCEQVKPFTMLDFELEDTDLWTCFAALALMLVLFRWLTYLVLRWKIGSCI